LHLNASKCSFGVNSGKFLGYMIIHRGIEVNPDQIKAIEDLHPPQNPKEVQKLMEKEEVLYAYIAVTDHAVSLVLVRTENRVQKSVYYVSKSLPEVETRYLPLEKAVLAIIHATRKLPHYFQVHTVVVLTQLLL